MSKLQPTWPEKLFREAWNISKKHNLFHLFRTVSKQISAFRQILLKRVVKNPLWLTRRRFREKKFLKKLFLNVVRKIFRRVLKADFYVSRGLIWVDSLWKFGFFVISTLWAKNCVGFRWNFSKRLPKRHSTCPRKKWKKKEICEEPLIFSSISDFYQNNIGLLAEKFRHGCRNGNLHFPAGILEEICYPRRNVFYQFPVFSKEHWTFCRKVSVGSSRLQTSCPGESFWET